MRSALLALALLAAREASASCVIEPAIFGGSTDVPLGCPVVVYDQFMSATPQVFANRPGGGVDVTGTFATENTLLDVHFTGISIDCVPIDHLLPVGFSVHTITLSGAQVGDVLTIDGYGVGTVVASGACPAAMPLLPVCIEGVPGCDEVDPPDDAPPDDDDPTGDGGGCSSAPGGGLVIALAMAFLRRRRR